MSNTKTSDSKVCDQNVESCRRALLGYYNSQTMTHGGYIIALLIGILTLFSIQTEFTEPLLARVVFLFLFSSLVSLGFYIAGRTLLWGCLAYYILDAQPSKNPKLAECTDMYRLYAGTKEKVYDNRKLVYYFAEVDTWRINLPLIIIILGLILSILSIASVI